MAGFVLLVMLSDIMSVHLLLKSVVQLVPIAPFLTGSVCVLPVETQYLGSFKDSYALPLFCKSEITRTS